MRRFWTRGRRCIPALLGLVIILTMATAVYATIAGGRVSCATTPTLLSSGAGTVKVIGMKNKGASSVFLGGSNVTASGGLVGYELGASDVVSMAVGADESLYCIAASGTVRVDYLTGRGR